MIFFEGAHCVQLRWALPYSPLKYAGMRVCANVAGTLNSNKTCFQPRNAYQALMLPEHTRLTVLKSYEAQNHCAEPTQGSIRTIRSPVTLTQSRE